MDIQAGSPGTKKEKSRNWLKYATIATGVYVFLVIFVFTYGMKTPAQSDCFQGYFPCLEPLQIADVLAGFFAPLAFLWLVAAVLVQSEELKGQQQEIGSQIKSLINAEVRSLIDQLHPTLQDRINGKVSVALQQGDSYKILDIPSSYNIEEALYLMSTGLQKFATASEVGIRNGQLSITRADREDLEVVYAATCEIIALGKDALPSQQTRIKHLDLPGLRDAIEVFLKCRQKDVGRS